MGSAGPAPAGHNDRPLERRQGRLRQLLLTAATACAIAIGLVLTSPIASADEEPGIDAARLEIARQHIDGRLSTIERKLDGHRSRLIPVAPIILHADRDAPQASGNIPIPHPLRSNDLRLDLERRALEQRRHVIDHAQQRVGGDNPSSGGLLERLRSDQK